MTAPLDLGELERLALEVKALEPAKSGKLDMKWWNANDAFQAVAHPSAVLSLIEEVKRLREALTPSGDTKAAYSGEFKMPVTQTVFDEDGELDEVTSALTIEWTTIKEIMAAISARAALPAGGSE